MTFIAGLAKEFDARDYDDPIWRDHLKTAGGVAVQVDNLGKLTGEAPRDILRVDGFTSTMSVHDLRLASLIGHEITTSFDHLVSVAEWRMVPRPGVVPRAQRHRGR